MDPEINFVIISMVYLYNPFNNQAPRPLEGIYGTDFPVYTIYIPIMRDKIYIHRYVLFLSMLQVPLTMECPEPSINSLMPVFGILHISKDTVRMERRLI